MKYLGEIMDGGLYVDHSPMLETSKGDGFKPVFGSVVTGRFLGWLMLREFFPSVLSGKLLLVAKRFKIKGWSAIPPLFVEWWCRVVQ